MFNLAHPRWEFVFQPTYAADLNLIEPWWKILRSLALPFDKLGAGGSTPGPEIEQAACTRHGVLERA